MTAPRDLPESAPAQLSAEDVEAAGLIYVSDHDPGIRRRKAGTGFSYLRPDGGPVRDERTLDRIRKLAIPPAWVDVWICPDPRGHIQATGRDQKRRKQYRYHDGWRQVRDENKYDRLIAFGRALPKLRRRMEHDLARHGLPREKVLATVVRLMEITLIRVGNEEYAKQNKSFGLTTLRDRHARIEGSRAIFEFRGKSGKMRRTGVRDRRLARIVKACQDLPGQRLFQYIDEDGVQRTVESADVNDYLREAMGDDFSAKDFRTWAGTLAAAQALAMNPECASASQARRHIATCIKAVAGLLGNTAAVCRSAYIHPAVLTAYEHGALPVKPGLEGRALELAVIQFLEEAHDAVETQLRAEARGEAREAPERHAP
ncbi:MAG TPA: DNA topoisomerase IB [Phenylobacterium sp.]|uniref:DNA topoisomerase IB n=1 Tax=Phenylobacterium sp. TaxID=1871053 RepID=UPI002D0B0183|nr:DNA topoisomerase IB [Phenylobacterium sp.]HSV03153.1 DNA topoisomerase IB [Phenylobacterium sp.]